MCKDSNSSFIEKGLSFFVPFLGLIWFIKKKNKVFNFIGFIVNLCICIGLVILLIKFFPITHSRFIYFGKKPLCNLKEERAMHFGSFVFVLCYRCTFLIIGAFVSFFTMYIKKARILLFYILFSGLLIVPCLLDGVLQLTTEYESTNLLRAMTGFCAGFGFGYFLYIPFKKWNLFF
ncbi:MAG: DUF2085 domain-containing protein [Anaeroplasmataceae bacterium]|nr:DUF2085 domain-containing protein [Anaeroplasmataceae bacterium]